MENLNVIELRKDELSHINGGSYWGPIAGMYILLEAALNPTAHYEAFMQGWNDAVN